MSDILDQNGLQTKTLNELKSELISDLQTIYGNDINVDQNSPDGQTVVILSQDGVDLRELLQSVNAGFDPDQAEGRILDQRVGINGIKRAGGTFTTVLIDIETDRAVNLVGLDSEVSEVSPTIDNLYTIRDNSGTQYYLSATTNIASAGTTQAEFRASEIGLVEITIGTITTPVTTIAGIISVNNPAGALVQGQNEESDSELRLRRKRSTAISSEGFLDGLESAILDLDGVVASSVTENDTNVTDGDGTEAHTIWVIADGGSDADIAQTIYAKKTAGGGMRGAVTYDITRPDNRVFTAKFDRPNNVDFYVRFSLAYPSGVVDTDFIKQSIVENVIWSVGQTATADSYTCYVKSINPEYQITGMEISDDGLTWLEVVAPGTPQDRFINDVSRITIT